ncbi:MAG: hypothetical protein KDK70_20190 [Myxococcales bacterium]|nr:hypothetical protein [Myxococcales bacterium]
MIEGRPSWTQLRIRAPREHHDVLLREGIGPFLSERAGRRRGHFIPDPEGASIDVYVEGDGEGTVYFGMAGRGGGPGIYVFLDDHAPAERLPGGWTTVHEMLHHGMPFIDEPWMSEGWVTYYTELLRTRAGFRSEEAGWRAMVEGFGRGRRTRGMTLEEASARMRELHVYQRVYWGGAAVALLVDVQMRLETDGARSLDDAMRELRRCCGDADHQWAARELLEELDAWYGRPLFTQTADAVLAQPELPDVEAVLAKVGVRVEGDRVRLDDDPAKARHRRAMMAPRPGGSDGSDDDAARSR